MIEKKIIESEEYENCYLEILKNSSKAQDVFLSCGARKPVQTQKDLLTYAELPLFYMKYKYFLTVVSKLWKAIYRRTGVRCVQTQRYYIRKFNGIFLSEQALNDCKPIYFRWASAVSATFSVCTFCVECTLIIKLVI